jgi:dual specificity phosphatase 12
VEGNTQEDIQTSPASDEGDQQPPDTSKLQIWQDFGHKFESDELEDLKRSIAGMALSRIDGQEELYVGG